MDAAAELGRNPVSKDQIQPEYYGDEQADAGRDYQTRLARPNSQARTETVEFFPVQLTTSRIGNLTRLIHTLLYVTTMHIYLEGLQRSSRSVIVGLDKKLCSSYYTARCGICRNSRQVSQ